jgi:hypothetical protein
VSEQMDKGRREDNYSLEDILAEYKGNAHIADESNPPAQETHSRAEEIIGEERASESPKKAEILEFRAAAPEKSVEEAAKEIITREIGEYFEEMESRSREKYEPPKIRHIRDGTPESEDGEGREENPQELGLFGRRRKKKPHTEEYVPESEDELTEEPYREPLDPDEEIPEDEPNLKAVYRAYGAKAHSLKRRCVLAAPLCLILAYIVFAGDFGLPLPQILSSNPFALTLTVLIADFIVVVLGYDILWAGIRDLVLIKASAETLVSVACIASLMDAAYIAITRAFEKGMPFCAVAACSMFFAMLGACKTARGYMLTFRVASAGSYPYCVSVENDRVEGGCVLIKNRDSSRGFVTRAHRRTLTEKLCIYIAPLLVLGSLGLSLVASLGTGRVTWFFRCFAAMSSVCAPFSLLLVFGHPFKTLAKRLSAAGAALAGWQGACDCGGAIGLVIKDEDLFPPGTLAISGVTVLSKVSRDRLISCTGSLIIRSGSGLSDTFAEYMRAQRCHVLPVDDFACYEGGGLSGLVGSDRILVGSSGFMNLMGIRLQENLNIKNAIFCAINDRLSGVFLVNYNPIGSVQSALMTILTRKILSLFAIRDFNITTMMLKQKFKIPSDRAECIEVLSYSERYRLSEPPERKKQPTALVLREGLAPYVQTILGGRSLQTAVYIGAVISLLGAILGLVIMFLMCKKGAFEAATASNTLMFMTAWLIPIFFLSGLTSKY